MKEDDIVEQLHLEKKDLQTKVDKLEKVLHSLNSGQRQDDAEVDMSGYDIVKSL